MERETLVPPYSFIMITICFLGVIGEKVDTQSCILKPKPIDNLITPPPIDGNLGIN